MTTKNQHMFAAIAAGITFHELQDDGAWIILPSEVEDGQRKVEWWSPLHSNHDAFNLLVILNPMAIDASTCGDGALVALVQWANAFATKDAGNLRAATFNLAAEIGKRMAGFAEQV